MFDMIKQHVLGIKRLRLPLHLTPMDDSVEADSKRLELYQFMSHMNPKGFRQPANGKHAKQRIRTETRTQKLANRMMGV